VLPCLVLACLVAKMAVVTAWGLLAWVARVLRSFSLGLRVPSFRQMSTRLLVGGWLRARFREEYS
jgi:hypothetical protein